MAKAGHWETGKTEDDVEPQFRMRKSEDLRNGVYSCAARDTGRNCHGKTAVAPISVPRHFAFSGG